MSEKNVAPPHPPRPGEKSVVAPPHPPRPGFKAMLSTIAKAIKALFSKKQK